MDRLLETQHAHGIFTKFRDLFSSILDHVILKCIVSLARTVCSSLTFVNRCVDPEGDNVDNLEGTRLFFRWLKVVRY